jgi:glycogen debranching enzyme
VPKNKEDFPKYNICEKHVRQTEIYKDLAFSSKVRNEYQLRCNACVAIGVAPEL